MEDWSVIAVSKSGAPVPGAQASISADLLNRQSALERLGDAKGATHLSGTVLLKALDFRSIAPQELRRRIGMVMQTAYLFPGTLSTETARRNSGAGPDRPSAAACRLARIRRSPCQ